jgi:hypothetical protein
LRGLEECAWEFHDALHKSKASEVPVTAEERMKMEELCRQIAIEKDPKTFEGLIEQLNDLLEIKHRRIDPGYQPKPRC